MDVNDLLSVSPKLLAQAILHQRERLIEQIPADLETGQADLAKSEPLAKAARLEREKINTVLGLEWRPLVVVQLFDAEEKKVENV